MFAKRCAFYTRQEYVKDSTKTLVVSGRPLSHYLLWYLIATSILRWKWQFVLHPGIKLALSSRQPPTADSQQDQRESSNGTSSTPTGSSDRGHTARHIQPTPRWRQTSMRPAATELEETTIMMQELGRPGWVSRERGPCREVPHKRVPCKIESSTCEQSQSVLYWAEVLSARNKPFMMWGVDDSGHTVVSARACVRAYTWRMYVHGDLLCNDDDFQWIFTY